VVKKRIIPPPLFDPSLAASFVSLDGGDVQVGEQLAAALSRAGVVPVFEEVCREFIPFVDRKLANLKTSDAKTIGSGAAMSTADRVRVLSRGIALFYVGRRLGTFLLRFTDSTDEGAHHALARNDTGAVLSLCLEQLSEIVGRRASTHVFRKLEAITEKSLDHRFGRSK
jgi:hypothetical protein